MIKIKAHSLLFCLLWINEEKINFLSDGRILGKLKEIRSKRRKFFLETMFRRGLGFHKISGH